MVTKKRPQLEIGVIDEELDEDIEIDPSSFK